MCVFQSIGYCQSQSCQIYQLPFGKRVDACCSSKSWVLSDVFYFQLQCDLGLYCRARYQSLLRMICCSIAVGERCLKTWILMWWIFLNDWRKSSISGCLKLSTEVGLSNFSIHCLEILNSLPSCASEVCNLWLCPYSSHLCWQALKSEME